jgi:hypothetical protein
MTLPKLSLLFILLAWGTGTSTHAQQQQTPQPPPIPPQTYPVPAAGDEVGYEPIFDGKTLNGWEGDPKYWRVENGALVGEVTPETLLKTNSFIIWRGGSPKTSS